jgi:2-C-methyl-D-erythritol 4-phosphate cytidylyltransferase/2-C-methyl-D-erythritol 2,4-cyclodiphosphate synthase
MSAPVNGLGPCNGSRENSMQKQDQNRGTHAALIVAAGSGVRAGLTQGRPKQYCSIGGEAVLRRTVCAFLEHPKIDHVIVALRAGDEALYEEALAGLSSPKLLRPVPGGTTRQLSVKAGLDALEALAPDAVLIHDAARPFISAACISGTIAALELFDGAIAAAPVTDTLKRGEGGAIAGTVSREGLWRAQTPQTFHYKKILEAHRSAVEAGRTDFTDDAVIAEWAGLTVGLVENAAENMKITTAGDLAMADLIAGGGAADVRCGTGFDVHAFGEGDHVTLCGIKVPHTHGFKAHSDGDAALHALTDALLGTIGAGDIGDHFPPSDPQWRGMDSAVFLTHALKLVAARGGRITNADITIVCERPKIGPHREAMCVKVAGLLGVERERVSVKATTSEGLGFTGRQEGISALATATVVFGRS